MEDTLSRFVDKTGCDPSFARDLLEGKKWDFDEAVKAFKEFSLEPEENQTKTRIVNKPRRGISVVNSDIVFKARTKVLEGDSPANGNQFDTYKDTFILPDLSAFPQDFGDFLRKDLIETSALVALEQSGHLNWWADIGVCQRLVPLATVGDGNCLLHAASLGMWGFHDRLLTLRKALFRTLIDHPASGAIQRRWKLQQYQKNMEAGGLVYTDEEWKNEWEEVLRLSSTNRRKVYSSSSKSSLNQPTISAIDEGQSHEHKEVVGENDKLTKNDRLLTECPNSSPNNENEKCPEVVKGSTSVIEDKATESESQEMTESEDSEGAFESLEDIHVFVLAHVLRRPIIIIADKYLRDFSGDPIAPIPFGGIYLPFECPHQTCHKTPLILVFESAHFSAAVASDDKTKHSKLTTAIPVVDRDLSMLPLHFSVDPGEKFDWITLNDETQLPAKFTFNAEKKFDFLEKYLNIVHVRVSNSARKEAQQGKKDVSQAEKGPGDTDKKVKKGEPKNGEGKEVSWLNNPITKVGNFADKIKKLVDTSTVCVAKIQTNEKPEYYEEMIDNYIQSTRKRFEEKNHKQQQNLQGNSKQLEPCITPGCTMYGRADTSYLCSGCYKTQKSASESGSYKNSSKSTSGASSAETNTSLKPFLPPPSLSSFVPYDYFTEATSARTSTPENRPIQPPSYSEACKGRMTNRTEKCRKDGCEFYGSPERKGYCSSCYKKQMTQL